MSIDTVSRTPGATSQIEYFFITTPTTGVPLTGLLFSSPGALAHYVTPGAVETPIVLITQTVAGAYDSGGFVEVDATNNPGLYRFDPPDAMYASGVSFRTLQLSFTGAIVRPLQIELAPVADVNRINGSAQAAINLAAGALGITVFTCVTGSTTTVLLTDLTETTANHYKNAIALMTSGAAAGQRIKVGQFAQVGGNGELSSFTEGPGSQGELLDAPGSGDTGILV